MGLLHHLLKYLDLTMTFNKWLDDLAELHAKCLFSQGEWALCRPRYMHFSKILVIF